MGSSTYLSSRARSTSRGSGNTQNVVSNNLDVEAYIIKSFLSDMAFDSLDLELTNQELEDFMQSEMESNNLTCRQLERTLHLAASLIEVGYHNHSLAEKKNLALYNWYLIYVDDMASKDPTTYGAFEQRFLSGRPQLNPVLDALVKVLMRMWDLYDPICANSIIAATFEFVTSSCIEPKLEKLPLIQGTHRFSWFLRERTGVATPFALFIFPQSTQFDFMEYIQAMPDMNFWIDLTNDLISFHKEELAGETANYVHTRAQIENKQPLQVLAEMAEELRTSRDTIYKILSPSPNVLRAWKVFERGYIGWHLAQDRYKLKDLDI